MVRQLCYIKAGSNRFLRWAFQAIRLDYNTIIDVGFDKFLFTFFASFVLVIQDLNLIYARYLLVMVELSTTH